MWRRRRENNNDPTSTVHRPHIDPIKTIKMRRWRRENNRSEVEEEEGIITLRRENNEIEGKY